MEDNTELTLRDLLALAKDGKAADFTALIQEALNGKAEDTVIAMVEDDEELDLPLDDDIDDVPDDEELDDEPLEEDALDERNALNHQKSRAFRSGVKGVVAKGLPSTPYLSRNDKWDREGTEKKKAETKAKKEKATHDASAMYHDASSKGIKLGGKSRQFSHIRQKGADVRNRDGASWKREISNTASNADAKERYGRGRFANEAMRKKHETLRRSVDDLAREAGNHLSRHGRADGDNEKYGKSFSFDKKDRLEPHHIENLAKLHAHVQAIHDTIKKHLPEELDLDLLEADLEEIAAELAFLTEGHSYSNRDDNDDSIKAKGGAKRFNARKARRKWKISMEEAEPGSLSLDEDMTEEELLDLAEVLTDEHFELLDDDSQQRLLAVIQ